MKINTKYFGPIEINSNNIITFPQGIPAFEDIKEYTLIDLPDNPAFTCLQSTKKEEVAFLLINPWDFFPDYDINIPQEDLEELDIKTKEQIAIYTLVTIPQDPNNITTNLMGPIIINTETQKAKQIILHQEHYHTKHLLTDEQKAVESC